MQQQKSRDEKVFSKESIERFKKAFPVFAKDVEDQIKRGAIRVVE
jgi:Ca2+-binding EF-hand superfamily protein